MKIAKKTKLDVRTGKMRMPVEGYVWAYPCGQSLGTSGCLQVVQTGANIAYAFTHEEK